MKTLLSILILLCSLSVLAQDQNPIVVNISNSPVLSYANLAVKQKATVMEYKPIINGTKDFYIKVRVSYYQQLGGDTYGQPILSLIQACGTCSQDQKNLASASYQDWTFEYSTTGKYTVSLVNGNLVPEGTPGSVPEAAYWQNFTLTQAGIGSLNTGAFSAQYTMIAAIVAQMNTRKNW